MHLAKMSLHIIKPLPITKIGVDLILVKEVVTKAEVICVIFDPSVKLIVVDVGDWALCGRLDCSGVRLF